MSTNIRRLLAAILLGVLVYAGFAFYSGLGALAGRIAEFRWAAFAAACGLAFCNYLIRFLKWEYFLRLLDIRDVSKSDSLLIFFSGFTLTVTPGKVGEVFKSLLLKESHGVPLSHSAPIVVAERLTDVIGIIVLIVLGSLGFPGGLFWAGAGSVLVVICLVLISSDRIVPLMENLPGRLGAKIGPKARAAWSSLRTTTRPKVLLFPVILSVVAWAMEGIALWVILQGLGWHEAGLGRSVFFYSTSTLAGAIIPVPGGLGVTEGSMEEQLRILGGAPKDISTLGMILVRLATLWFAVFLGFLALAVFKRRYPSKR